MRELSDDLLAWYDVHARDMPWRIGPAARMAGRLPDPYAVWLSEVMLQQTTVAAVHAYHSKFMALWPNVAALAGAEDADVMAAWAGLGYYARARNLLKCARAVVVDFDGKFPETNDELLTLPGIGPYTAAAISAIAFDQASVVVDGNVERVMARLHNVHKPLPASKPALTALAAKLTPQNRAGDYAQAVMDLGATVCTPRNPACSICPLTERCAALAAGTASELPKKMPKKKVPTRQGFAYVARRDDGAWLLETRPEQGLLGGMLGFPTSEWTETPEANPPFDAEWVTLNSQARHTFTHFHLELTVLTTSFSDDFALNRGFFIDNNVFNPKDLPTAMRKVYDVVAATLRDN